MTQERIGSAAMASTASGKRSEGGDYQYRIKSAGKPFDRVVKGSELEAAM
jgi:hypothetical protein